MEIPIRAKVICKDGPCGQVVNIILKPVKEVVTHVVVMNDSYPATKYLVPIGHIAQSEPETITLSCPRQELMKMPIFDELQFVPVKWGKYAGKHYMVLPYFAPDGPYIRIEKEHIPASELVIRRGADVEATDGHIGRVDEFLINPENERITHLVLREGHLWGKKDISIPVSKIDHYQDNIVFLTLTRKEVEELPLISIRHPGR